jgi:hypothetical protein
VRAVDGHALATGVLAGLLADHPPAGDLAALRAELDAAARTDARVGKVLGFYAARLAEADRYLLAAISLFARPVPAQAVLAVAAHGVFGARLAGWTPVMVQAAVTGRLGGLASWHPDGTISAHPLVREAFRRLVLDAAGTAAETSLAGLPAGQVTSRADALRVVEAIELQICHSHAYLGWVAGLAGDTAEAERQFTAADQIGIADSPNGEHLYSLHGAWWAEWLARTGRDGPARALTVRNAEISGEQGWNEDVARCDRMLGRLALAAGDIAAGGEHLAAAAGCFRDGDLLIELAVTLADLAEHARVSGDLDAADRHATEAITIAAPRHLVPAQAAALAARARIRAAQAAAAADPDLLLQGRDAADAALRLATRHQLAWHELDALRAHTALDHAEHADHGWAAQATTLHARLVPPGLDPDPLATVEGLAGRKKRQSSRRPR